MVSNKAVDAFVVVHGVSGSELDDYFFVGVSLYGSFGLVEEEDVVGVCEELEIGLELGFIRDGENFGAAAL